MSYKQRAFIRYTSANKVIPGSLIIRKKIPHGKGWVEVDFDNCCTTTSTTTTTTTTTTSTTTTTTLP